MRLLKLDTQANTESERRGGDGALSLVVMAAIVAVLLLFTAGCGSDVGGRGHHYLHQRRRSRC